MMSTKAKIIIVIVSAILLITIAYFIFRKKKVNATVTNEIPVGSNTTLNSVTETFPLQAGSRGANTKRLQVALNRIAPGNKVSEDGVFGNATAAKLITSIATSLYTYGPKVTEAQLNQLIKMGNAA